VALRATAVLGAAAALGACGDNGGSDGDGFPVNRCADIKADHCVQIDGGAGAELQKAANSVKAGTTIVLGEGSFALDNQLTIRGKSIHVIGQGIEATILDFAATTAQVNGIDVIGDDFLVQDLTVKDSKKDGIRVE
jgi:hypothetical protein